MSQPSNETSRAYTGWCRWECPRHPLPVVPAWSASPQCEYQTRMARLHKQLRAQPQPEPWLFSCVRVPRLVRLDGNIDALVDLPLTLIVNHANMPHFARVGHMRAAIRLQIETHDLYGTHFCYTLWQQVNLGTNQV